MAVVVQFDGQGDFGGAPVAEHKIKVLLADFAKGADPLFAAPFMVGAHHIGDTHFGEKLVVTIALAGIELGNGGLQYAVEGSLRRSQQRTPLDIAGGGRAV